LQVSRINLKNSIVKPHINIGKYFKTKKQIQNECWVVIKGSINVSLYDLNKKKLKDIILNQGSILITIEGGHSINKSLNNAELIEIKLGPYTGKDIEYF
jgi:dTDP-4-dehydrorhamnose 3,5-epimerase-like enzyme